MTSTTTAPWSFAAAWGAQGQVSDLGGPVHWVRWEASEGASAAPIVFVHGLGGSHLNWVAVAEGLATDRTAYAVDLAGFGVTPGFPRDTSVQANAALVVRFVEEVVGEPVVLVGNSMGGMVSALMAEQRPDLVRAVCLVDPALPLVRGRRDPEVLARFTVFAVPRVGEVFLRQARTRLTPEQLVGQTLALCFADRTRVPEGLLDAAVGLIAAREEQGDALDSSFTAAARSLLRVLGRPRRYWDLLYRMRMPVLLVHGDRDRLVAVAAARTAAQRNPHWAYAELTGVGHTPQLEAPADFVRVVGRWLKDLP